MEETEKERRIRKTAEDIAGTYGLRRPSGIKEIAAFAERIGGEIIFTEDIKEEGLILYPENGTGIFEIRICRNGGGPLPDEAARAASFAGMLFLYCGYMTEKHVWSAAPKGILIGGRYGYMPQDMFCRERCRLFGRAFLLRKEQNTVQEEIPAAAGGSVSGTYPESAENTGETAKGETA